MFEKDKDLKLEERVYNDYINKKLNYKDCEIDKKILASNEFKQGFLEGVKTIYSLFIDIKFNI